MSKFIEPVKSLIKKSRRDNGHGGAIHRFPENLGAHAVILSFKDYDYHASQRGERVDTIPQSSIVLPLPANLQDSFDVRMNGAELGLMGRGLANSIGSNATARAMGEALGQGVSDVASGVYNSLSSADSAKIFENAKDWSSMAKYLTRNVMTGGMSAGVDVGTGSAVNPHMAVNFDGMNLKNHTFSWQFAPKSVKESEDLRHITQTIKRSITPRYANVGGFGSVGSVASEGLLKYPMMVDVFFLGIDTAYFYKFKRCLVQNFSTDYTPTGGHAILAGGKPAFVNMNMSLIETQIHTANDYEE